MVKAGYKETEIGVIPEDWEVGSIENFGRVLNGGTPNTSIKEYWNGDIPWCTPTDISKTRGIYIDKTVRSITHQGLSHSGATLLPKHSLLLCSRATIGELKINSTPIATNQGFKNIVMNNYKNVMFLFYLLQTKKKYMIEKAIGSTFLELSKKALCEIQLQIPSTVEQEKIAEALSDTDALILSLEKLIEKKKAIKQGAMQQLLTGKMRLPGFSGKWEEVTLDKLGIFTGVGVDKLIKKDELQVTLLNYLDVYKNNILFKNTLSHTVTATKSEIWTYSIKKSDIFFTPTSETAEDIAKSAVSMEDMPNTVYSYHVIRFRPSNCNSIFLKWLFDTIHFRNQAVKLCDGCGTRYVVSVSKFKLIKLSIPPTVKEQTAIANILSDMDNEISKLEKKLHKYRQVKQGMMQELLTGRIRLITPDTKETAVTQITQQKGHNQKFGDAIVIGAIVDAFYSDTYTLGRKKVQKLLYFFRRKQHVSVDDFKKKAAGPYADEVRYKGGEPIAIRNKYIKTIKTQKGTKFEKGEGIEGALQYIDKWQMQSDLDWLVNQFKYIKTDKLELLATIDMAMQDLKNESIVISVATVKELIRNNKEWKAKLSKSYFSDEDIAWAIEECKKLFKTEE